MKPNGFTLLEVLVVVGIMGLMAAMIWPMRGTLDDSQRERVTTEKMDSIVEAILGHDQVKDPYDMSRIIGGYVGDMGEWPDLYEPGGSGLGGVRGAFNEAGRFQWLPFQKVSDTKKESLGQPRGLWTRYLTDKTSPDITGDDWKGPYLTPPVTRNPALGRHYAKNQAEYEGLYPTDREYFHLLQGNEQLTDGWNRAFRFFITDNGETFCIVSLGPRGFGYEDDGYGQDCDPDSSENQGKIVRALHKSDWKAVKTHSSRRSSVTTKLIFLTEDRIEQNIVRALIGESPSGPNTGYTGDLLDWPELFNYVCRFDRDPNSLETTGGHPYPCDGTVCMEVGGTNEWEVQPGEVRDENGDILSGSYVRGTAGSIESRNCLRVEGALQCTSQNSQTVGFDCDLPKGIWERQWRDPNSATTADYTYGQPRGMWDRESIEDPSLQSTDNGIGWRTPYIPKPIDNHAKLGQAEPEEYLSDAFEQPLHFFNLDNKDAFLILSGGESGGFFYDYGGLGEVFEFPQRTFDYRGLDPNESIAKRIELTQEYLERKKQNFKIDDYKPDSTEKVDTPSGAGFYDNTDNILRVVYREEWDRGFLTVDNLWIDNLSASDLNSIKCRLYGVLDLNGVPQGGLGDGFVEVACGGVGVATGNPDEFYCSFNTGVLYQPGGSGPYAWLIGYRLYGSAMYVNDANIRVFRYTSDNNVGEPLPGTAVTGGRYLVCEYNDGTNQKRWEKIIPAFGHPSKKAEIQNLYLDGSRFW
ncbi:type II secretion system protein [Desulfonatronum thiodismutans]|uniref:type II secretion system protein n=1 Tax=Desulfonatronum thiodismutans TaxID=159290 RepID=UPI0004ABD84D|nr:type II secretion system protein [Desulfonatronum thiodismutans]